ncbi:MAG: phage tail tape measure protein, partial [Campylobacter sputorum]|uniref:phage tail tape measure protein n=1 Tax=Campylobacter sputorum TaxID=206 RepID=UPI002A9131A3
MTNETIGITIGVALKGIAELSKLKGGFEDIKKSVEKATGGIKGFEKQLNSIKLSEDKRLKLEINKENLKTEFLSATSLIARGTAIAMPVKLAMDFESAMADVKKVVDFDSVDELKEFENKIKNLSRTIPLSLSELTQITASGGQLGIKKEDLMDFTTIVAKMSTAFDMSASDAGASMANLMNIYGLGIKKVTELGDTINFLDNNMNAKARDITQVVGRIGGTAKVFGLSSDQASALGAAFLSLGKSPEVAATGINAMLTKLATADKQGEKFQEALQSIGLDATMLKSTIAKDPQKALELFLDTLQKVPKNAQMGIMSDLFGMEYADDVSLLVGSLDEYKKALKLINDENKKDSMDKEFKARSETTANSLQLLKNAVSEIGVNFGSVFLPAISGIAKMIASFTNKMTDLTNTIPGLNSVLGFAFVGFLTLKPAILSAKLAANYFKDTKELLNIALQKIIIKTKMYIGILRQTTIHHKIAAFFTNAYKFTLNSLKFVIGGVGKAFRLLVIGIKAVSIAMMSNPLGLILGGIAIAAGLIIANWDKVKAWFISFVEWLRPLWEPLVNSIKQIWDSISPFFSFLGDIWKGIFSGVADFIGAVFIEPIEWIKGLFTPLFEWLEENFAWVGSMLSGITKGVKKALNFFGVGGEEGGKDYEINGKKVSKEEFDESVAPLKKLREQRSAKNLGKKGDYPLIASAYPNTQTITNNHTAMQNGQSVNISFGNITANDFDKADFERYIKSYFRKEEQNAR